jgi:hypothetical protein
MATNGAINANALDVAALSATHALPAVSKRILIQCWEMKEGIAAARTDSDIFNPLLNCNTL